MNILPEKKVAILRIDYRQWETLTPAQQLNLTMHHMLDFMASPAFHDFEGLSVQVCDAAILKPLHVVLQVGEKPATGLITIN